jgi:hypothetical protein
MLQLAASITRVGKILFLRLIRHYTMKIYEGVEVGLYLHAFLWMWEASFKLTEFGKK